MVKKVCKTINGEKCIDETLMDAPDEMSQYIENKRSDLRFDNDTTILLLLAWATDLGRRQFELFSEILIIDAAENTNSSQRSLVVIVGKDSNRQTFTAAYAFMPSHRGHAFQILFEQALPIIFGYEVLSRVKVCITDGEYTMYSPLDGLINSNTIYTSCRHFLSLSLLSLSHVVVALIVIVIVVVTRCRCYRCCRCHTLSLLSLLSLLSSPSSSS